jgi:hypothetical protein
LVLDPIRQPSILADSRGSGLTTTQSAYIHIDLALTHVDDGNVAIGQCLALRFERVVDLVSGGKTSGTYVTSTHCPCGFWLNDPPAPMTTTLCLPVAEEVDAYRASWGNALGIDETDIAV